LANGFLWVSVKGEYQQEIRKWKSELRIFIPSLSLPCCLKPSNYRPRCPSFLSFYCGFHSYTQTVLLALVPFRLKGLEGSMLQGAVPSLLFFLTLMHIFEYSLFVKFSSEYSI
jgi:hypothetical protein